MRKGLVKRAVLYLRASTEHQTTQLDTRRLRSEITQPSRDRKSLMCSVMKDEAAFRSMDVRVFSPCLNASGRDAPISLSYLCTM